MSARALNRALLGLGVAASAACLVGLLVIDPDDGLYGPLQMALIAIFAVTLLRLSLTNMGARRAAPASERERERGAALSSQRLLAAVDGALLMGAGASLVALVVAIATGARPTSLLVAVATLLILGVAWQMTWRPAPRRAGRERRTR